LLSSLTPGAFLKLAEESDGNEKTGEMQMLEVSRREIRKSVAGDARGISRLGQSLFVFWYYYIYDPIATGFRFVHLVAVFLPLILTVPLVWFGKRIKDRKGARSGTLWWYRFLVRSMERAGPAFIKVGHCPAPIDWELQIKCSARTDI
jgi:aarF domain-containing kinase